MAIALIVGANTVVAAGDPYVTGTTGYDVSYPNCAARPTGDFGIVGVNGGRPFTTNSCFAAEYSAAPSPSLYINTGYAPAYRKNISSACSTASASVAGTSAQRQAWAIGCSEAKTSLGIAGGRGSAMWWLDVETANSWSSSNLTLNQYAIQGATTTLAQTGAAVGVYSTAGMWAAVTGASRYTPAGLSADWVAGGTCSTPFTSSPVWLVQAVSGGLDRDTAC